MADDDEFIPDYEEGTVTTVTQKEAPETQENEKKEKESKEEAVDKKKKKKEKEDEEKKKRETEKESEEKKKREKEKESEEKKKREEAEKKKRDEEEEAEKKKSDEEEKKREEAEKKKGEEAEEEEDTDVEMEADGEEALAAKEPKAVNRAPMHQCAKSMNPVRQRRHRRRLPHELPLDAGRAALVRIAKASGAVIVAADAVPVLLAVQYRIMSGLLQSSVHVARSYKHSKTITSGALKHAIGVAQRQCDMVGKV